MKDPLILLTIFGLILAAVLMSKNVKSAFLLAMIVTSVVGMVAGLVAMPDKI